MAVQGEDHVHATLVMAVSAATAAPHQTAPADAAALDDPAGDDGTGRVGATPVPDAAPVSEATPKPDAVAGVVPQDLAEADGDEGPAR